MAAALPRFNERICWTRMQAEAGQQLTQIVRRKEFERSAGNGLFFWGVGNPPPRAIAALARASLAVDVLFSVMKSKPKPQDNAPARVLAWRRYLDVDGTVKPLPPHVLVTSRAGARDCHYALICRSDTPLMLKDEGPFDPRAFRNIGGVGGTVGASQVTALLERHAPDRNAHYRISMRATMAFGYWVKLVDPVEVTEAGRAGIDEDPGNEDGWMRLVDLVRSHCRPGARRSGSQPRLFAI